MSFFENTRKPVGLGGRIMASMMNLGHTPVASWGLEFLHLSPDANVLDCGCDGGANIKRLLKKCPNGTVTGIDYSSVSVEKSKKLNAKTIAEGHCRVLEASVAMLPFENEKFDVVTAFETVYFWPGPTESFREVCRVLKPNGLFLIVNESDGTNRSDEKWLDVIEGLQIFDKAQLSNFLKDAGFSKIIVDHDETKHRLCIMAMK